MIYIKRAFDRSGLLQRFRSVSDRFYITDFEELRASSLVRDAEQGDIEDWYKTLGGKDIRSQYLRIFMRNIHNKTNGDLEQRRSFYTEQMQECMHDPNQRYLANFLALSDETWRLAMRVVHSYDAYDSTTLSEF